MKAPIDTSHPDTLLDFALKYEEQAKYERDPCIVAHLLRERDWFLNEAAASEIRYLEFLEEAVDFVKGD